MQWMDRDGLLLVTQNIYIGIQALLRRLIDIELLWLVVIVGVCLWLFFNLPGLIKDINVVVILMGVVVTVWSSVVHNLTSSLLDHLIPGFFDVLRFLPLYSFLLDLSLLAH